MQTLARDKSLDAFRVEYEKLFRTVKHSHEVEKRLQKKLKMLNDECRQLTQKQENLLTAALEDETQIETLKAELESAWRQVDDASDLEMSGKEKIAKLQVEIAELTRRCDAAENGEDRDDVDGDDDNEGDNNNNNNNNNKNKYEEDGQYLNFSGSGGNSNKVSGYIVRRLQRDKETLQLERDEKVDEVVQLRQEISQQRERARTAETKKLDLECECAKLKDIANVKKSEAEKLDSK